MDAGQQCEPPILNRAISAARHAHYSITEPLKLKTLRWLYGVDYDDSEFIWNGPTPLISVVIPTFNRADLLIERALKSAIAQTYPNWEIIVAAHGCTDGTRQKVERFAKEFRQTRGLGAGVNIAGFVRLSPFDKDIRVIEVPRKRTYPPTPENHWFAGPVAPINAALDECRGAWIARLDDDDEWAPEHLETLLQFAQSGNYEFASSAYETPEKTVPHDGHPTQPIGGVQTWLYRSYLKSFKANPDCWRKAKGDNQVNDTDLAQRFRDMGVRIGHLNQVTAKVLPRPGTNLVGLKAYKQDERATLAQLAF